MAIAPITTKSADQADEGIANAADLRWYVFALFFIFGGITSLNDVLIPKLKHLFTLSFFEAMLIQFAFFTAYFVISLPAAAILKRYGHMRTAAIGLLVMSVGCLLFIPAANSGIYATFLGALFVLASGITIVQVVANPLISKLGPSKTVHSRLTFAQAFNSVGTTVFPFFGSMLLLGSLANIDPATLLGAERDAFLKTEAMVISNAYLGIAIALIAIAFLVWMGRTRLPEAPIPSSSWTAAFDLLKRPRFAFGTLGIFVYVGAEVAIGSILVNYLSGTDVWGVSAQKAGEALIFYWGGAMVGRFVGAALLRMFPPSLVLLSVALIAGALLVLSGMTQGFTAGVAILAIGLFNSIMFPTIFSLACEGLGERSSDGSGIICMAIVGGAIVPLLMGFMADVSSLKLSFVVPLICYATIGAFGIYCWKKSGANAAMG